MLLGSAADKNHERVTVLGVEDARWTDLRSRLEQLGGDMDAKHDRRAFLRAASGRAAVTAALSCGAVQGAPQTAPQGAAASAGDLCFKNARDLASLIRTRKVSAREVMAAHLDRINRVNPTINAIVAKLDDPQCLALADAADRRVEKREPLGPLHGLPMAFKDLQMVSRPRRASSRSQRSGGARRAAEDVRHAWLHRRGRVSGSQRSRLDLPDGSRVSQHDSIRDSTSLNPGALTANGDHRRDGGSIGDRFHGLARPVQ